MTNHRLFFASWNRGTKSYLEMGIFLGYWLQRFSEWLMFLHSLINALLDRNRCTENSQLIKLVWQTRDLVWLRNHSSHSISIRFVGVNHESTFELFPLGCTPRSRNVVTVVGNSGADEYGCRTWATKLNGLNFNGSCAININWYGIFSKLPLTQFQIEVDCCGQFETENIWPTLHRLTPLTFKTKSKHTGCWQNPPQTSFLTTNNLASKVL